MSVTEGGTGPADDRPLTQQEYQLVQRLFSDPFSFPIQFKAWLVSYLETSDLNLPFSAVNGLIDMLGITGVSGGSLGILPAGIILPYGGDTAPTGSKLCDGSSYLRSTEARLFAAIGTRYGAPDASSFYVPDIRERIPVGKGTVPAHDTLGKTEGRALGQRGTAHTHRLPGDGSGNVSTGGGTNDGQIVLTDYGPSAHSIPEPGKPVDGPSFVTVNFIIVA